MIEQRAEDAPSHPVQPGRVNGQDWEHTRCRQCRRLLCKNTRDALKAGELVEIKCGGCNALNYLVGREGAIET